MGMTDYGRDKVLNACRGNADFVKFTSVYVALMTAAPAEDGTGGTEVSGGGYARTAGSFGAPQTGDATGRKMTNSSAVTFPTATGSQGTPGFFALYESSSATTAFAKGTITTPIAIGTGITPQYATGTLKLEID